MRGPSRRWKTQSWTGLVTHARGSGGADDINAGTYRLAGHEGARATFVFHVASGDVVGATYAFSDGGRACTIKTSPRSPTGWARSSRALSSPSELSIDARCSVLLGFQSR